MEIKSYIIYGDYDELYNIIRMVKMNVQTINNLRYAHDTFIFTLQHLMDRLGSIEDQYGLKIKPYFHQ